jgi:hypothetical protein
VYVVRAGAPNFEVTNLRAKKAMATGFAVGGIVGGLIGMALMKGVDTGADLERSIPANEAHSRLASRMIERLPAEGTPRWIDAAAGGATLAALPPSAPTLVLKLDKWGIKSHDDDEDAFRPILEVTARLSKDGAVIWKAECDGDTSFARPPLPTLTELRKDNHAVLRAMMEGAIDACADELTARLLGGPMPAAAVSEKREIRLTGKSLGDVETIVLGKTSPPGLAAGRFDARFNQVTLSAADVERLRRLILESIAGQGESELRLAGTIDGRPFEARMERNGAGRARVRFDGLRFVADPDVDAFLAAFTGPGVRRVDIRGEAAGRPIERSYPAR